MKINLENKLNLKEVIILSAVVSFLSAVLICAAAGVIGYNLIGDKLTSEKLAIKNAPADNQLSLSATDYERAVTDAVEKAAPSVVSIIVTKDLPVIERYYQENSPFGGDSFFEQFFGNNFFSPFQEPQYYQNGTEEREIGGGTGFVVGSRDGGSLILTNKHVVADEEASYTVLTNEGEKIAAEVLARDPVQDVAILKIDKTNLPAIKLGNSDNLKIGQTVIAIGNALGEFRNTVSVGVISGLKRSITAGDGYGRNEELSEVIQTDAAINQGNSGGPLLNLNGEAIAVGVAMAQGAENVGFALPINEAKRDVEQVIAEGKITYPFLGVRYILITPEIKEKNNLAVDYGALVVRGEEASDLAITPGSPADKAGLQENDIILEINGQKITRENPLTKAVRNCRIGEKITLKILSKGSEKQTEAILEERK